MGFWGKAQRVVMYKVRTEVEAKKKEVMDKQVGGGFRLWLIGPRGLSDWGFRVWLPAAVSGGWLHGGSCARGNRGGARTGAALLRAVL